MSDELIHSIREEIAGIRATMDGFAKTLRAMEKMEERQTKIMELLAANKAEHEHMMGDIQTLRDRSHKLASDVQAVWLVKEKQDRLEMRADDIEGRVESIEQQMPIINMAGGWVFKAALAVVGILGTVAAGVLIKELIH